MSQNKTDSRFEGQPLEEPDGGDEIVDLLQVVKPGKTSDAASDEEVDFSADLEAMLNSLSEAEKRAAGEDVAPFPDPTPVDHVVDHDESLDLPSTDEIDKLLEDLGGEDIADLEQPETVRESPGMEPAAQAVPADDPDALDAMPVENTPPAGEAPAQKVEIDDDFLAVLNDTAAKPVSLKTHVLNTKAKKEEGEAQEQPPAKTPPVVTIVEDAPDEEALDMEDFGEAAAIDDALLRDAEPPAQTAPPKNTPPKIEIKNNPAPKKEAEAVDTMDAPDAMDEVDLNELDALVDNVLAAAPSPAPISPVDPTALDKEFAKLRQDINKVTSDLRDSFAAMRKKLEDDNFAVLAKATSAESGVESLKTYLNEQTSSLARHTEMIDENAKLAQSQGKLLEDLKAELEKRGEGLKKAEEDASQAAQRVESAEKSLTEQRTRLEEIEKSVTAQGDSIQKLEQHFVDSGEDFKALSSLSARLEGTEQSMAEQVNRLKKSESGIASCEGRLKETETIVEEYAKGIQEAVQNLSELADRVGDLEAHFQRFEEQIEKTAAAAAAKVIREEIAALLKSGA